MRIVFTVLGVAVAAIAAADLQQRQHAILRNFPIIGHFRYLLEKVGPELRQYIVTSNTEEKPFNRHERRWVYASAKRQNNYFGFGTDQDIEHSPNYLIVKHSAFPISSPRPTDPAYDPQYAVPVAKVLGGARKRAKAFRPPSIVNISGMSFGSLSSNAIRALNAGAADAGCLHNTGEGGISPYHLQGGDLVWQLGSGYYGARDENGRLDLDQVRRTVEKYPIRAIELKLSQGAKPGLGGVLPAAKITPEIAAIRGVPLGQDCISPPSHPEFTDVDSLLNFVERIAAATGLPVGIKSAVGEAEFWRELAHRMAHEERGVDFITIDGGEGGTGASPLVFADRVALPFKLALSQVYSAFAREGITDDVVFIGSGKLGFPHTALLALSLGCDMINIGREAMMAIGCIQAQRCHTSKCPVGVATQDPWLVHGLDPTLKSVRLTNYIRVLRKELLDLCHACGQEHPALIGPHQLDILDDRYGRTSAQELFHYEEGWGLPSTTEAQRLRQPAPNASALGGAQSESERRAA